MRKVTPHWARHNKTSHLLKEGMSEREVQSVMGWSSIEMVKRYAGDFDGAGKKKANVVQFDVDIEIQTPKKSKTAKKKKKKCDHDPLKLELLSSRGKK